MSLKIKNPISVVGQLRPPTRLLFGPGPSNAHPRVHSAMALPQVGHLDPSFIKIIEDTKELMRYTWQTSQEFTIPISGTGSAAWEAVLANLIYPGDVFLCCVNGYFGERQCDMASRYKAQVERIDVEWGNVFTYEEIEAAVKKYRPRLLWICYAETSTGARQPLEGIGDLCEKYDCLFVLDTVTAIGGIPLNLDELKVNASYAGGQKCLACPPGISLLMLDEKALNKASVWDSKGEKVPNWYLDISMIRKYIIQKGSAPRVYHHTAPISMIYALREALTIIAEEGLEESWKRHQLTAEYFWELLEEAGLEMLIPNKNIRLHSLHTVKVPEGINTNQAITYIRENFNIEIGNGLGSLAGKVFRVGLMGYNSRKDSALLIVSALKEALKQQNWKGN
uniref:alanine--glyoxylate transaminase n=1 Tax=Nephromyces sp. MMRI TaxID=2496275 RepID=A0A3Q8UC26_9APIC|nr:serine-pyruvate transaminase [Nephromyces sp. MMRI]AZL94612.1 serine-pyruvate transaminase [Nephromyces sp. MMRI]